MYDETQEKTLRNYIYITSIKTITSQTNFINSSITNKFLTHKTPYWLINIC